MMGDSSIHEYQNISIVSNSRIAVGKIRFATAGMGFKNDKTGKVTTVSKDEMKKIQWLRACRGYALRILKSNGSVVRFDGFPEDVLADVKGSLRRLYDLDLDTREWSYRGWNWGSTEFQGNNLVFSVKDKPMLDLPMDEVMNTSMSAKNEVSLEFKLQSTDSGDDKEMLRGDQMVEMRFYVPPKVESIDDEDKVVEDSAQVFLDTVKTVADIGVVTGDAVVPFNELPFLIPRGRYEVDLFSDFMRMHGKSYDYKILFKSIKSMYLLPKPDDVHVLFVLGLDPPIRQGQTRYPYLVMQFLMDEEIEVTLNMEDEELKEKYNGKLKRSYEAPTSDVVSNILSTMAQCPIVQPSNFKTQHGASAFKCSMKASEGYMYPLEKSLLFVPKPTTEMKYSNIAQIVFSRVGAGATSRTIDMRVDTRSGGMINFGGITKEEFPHLKDYLQARGVRIKQDLENDDAFVALQSSSDDEEAARPAAAEDMDEDSEDDEDFVGGEDSDVAEEFDEEYQSDGDDNDDQEDGDNDDADEE